MKKIIFWIITMLFVLAAGLAYAGEVNKEPHNGITIFSTGPATFDVGAIHQGPLPNNYGVSVNELKGSAAGGAGAEESTIVPYNGVTVFSTGPATFDDPAALYQGQLPEQYGPVVNRESRAAGGVSAGESTEVFHNGITIFSTGPATFDDGAIDNGPVVK